MGQEYLSRGVITASSGNHGLGLAYLAGMFLTKAVVVVPTITPEVKLAKLKKYGAEVIIEGKTYDDSVERAKSMARNTCAVYVPSFDDPEIIAGNTSMGLEIYEDVPDVKQVICPIGGGGGLAGILLALNQLSPGVIFYGVQATGAPSMAHSLAIGKRIKLEKIDTIAEGIAVREPGAIPFALLKEHIQEVITVSDEDLKKAVKVLALSSKIIAEHAGGAALAGLYNIETTLKSPLVCVITGGNIDIKALLASLQS